MTNNIRNTEIELIEKKFNIASLLLGIVFIGLGVFAFIYSRSIDGNMLSSLMIFIGIVLIGIALFLIIARRNNTAQKIEI